jgi:hypothetical protein
MGSINHDPLYAIAADGAAIRFLHISILISALTFQRR